MLNKNELTSEIIYKEYGGVLDLTLIPEVKWYLGLSDVNKYTLALYAERSYYKNVNFDESNGFKLSDDSLENLNDVTKNNFGLFKFLISLEKLGKKHTIISNSFFQYVESWRSYDYSDLNEYFDICYSVANLSEMSELPKIKGVSILNFRASPNLLIEAGELLDFECLREIDLSNNKVMKVEDVIKLNVLPNLRKISVSSLIEGNKKLLRDNFAKDVEVILK